jgi:hypothetical protein
VSGSKRTAFESIGSPSEHALATTSPEFVASLEDF